MGTTYTRPLVNGTPTTGQTVLAGQVNEPIDQIYDTILAGGITDSQLAPSSVITSKLATAAVTAVKMDGTLPDASALATSAAPTIDKQVANKLYVDDGGERDINGSPTVVHTKYFTGTLDADSSTDVAHGVTAANILHVGGIAFNGATYGVLDFTAAEVAASAFRLRYDATNVIFDNVGSNNQGQAYRIKIDYTD